MIGAIIIAHGVLAEGLLNAAEMILGPIDGVEAVSVDPRDDPGRVASKIAEAVKNAGRAGRDLLILTDLFGGTPTNAAMKYQNGKTIEVVTGVNLPMLIKFFSHRNETDAVALGRILRKEGQRSIMLASEVLAGGGDL